MGFASRLPNSNEPPREEWAYGPQEPHDDFSALVNALAKRCANCKRVTMNQHLKDDKCPECHKQKD